MTSVEPRHDEYLPLVMWPASPCWPTRRPMRHASPLETIAGKNVIAEPAAIPAVVFTDPEIAWAGLTESETKKKGMKVDVIRYPLGGIWACRLNGKK